MLSRRQMACGIGSLSLAAFLPVPLARAIQGERSMPTVERSATRIAGFRNAELDFQLMRSLGATAYGGGAPGEIFHARDAIGEDPYAWPAAFEALARRVDALGTEAARAGHAVSARDHFLRSAMYWRAAEYFTDPFDRQMAPRGLASRTAFLNAARFLADRIEPVEIAFEGIMLPGYFMRPAAASGRTRTLLLLTGFDGTGEELYFQAARAGLERGFNVLIAEGPGQVGAMRFHPALSFRPDYERPIAAMIDHAVGRADVDAARLALYGISFGGYFALRGAAHDGRIRALVLNSPIVDLRAYMLGFLGGEDAVAQIPPLHLKEIDAVPDALMPPVQKLAFKASCRRFGVDSLAAWLERLRAFSATDMLAQIRCPTLAMIGRGEGEEAMRQVAVFRAGVSGPVTEHVFTAEDGADMHCQLGNLALSNAVVFDWLAATL
jgi:hypothetical protein